MVTKKSTLMKIVFAVIGLLLLALLLSGCATTRTRPSVAPPNPAGTMATPLDPEEAKVWKLAEAIRQRKEREALAKALRKADTPEMREARAILAKDAKIVAKNKMATAEAYAYAGLTGCKTQEERSAVKIVDFSAFGGTGYAPRVFVTATNLNPFPVSIRGDRGTVVEDLCSGGTITLMSKLGLYVSDDFYLQTRFTAHGVFPDGTPGTAESQSFSLSFQMRNQRQQNATWGVILHKR
jgi:uncharacterized protein YceK